MNQTTACTYPRPWPLSPLWPFSALAAAVSVASSPRYTDPPPLITDPPVGWLAKTHSMYVGRYGHLLLGNFSVSFQPMEGTLDGGTLLFQVGHVIIGGCSCYNTV